MAVGVTARRPPTAQSSGSATGMALLGAAATTAANFGIAVALAREGASLAGVFFAATAVVAILGNTAGLGTMTGLVYFMPACLSATTPNPRSILTYAAAPVTLAGLMGGAAIAVAATPIAGLLSPARTADAATMLRVVAVAVPAWALTVMFLGATRGLGSMIPTVVINQVLKPVLQLVGVVGLLVAGGEPSMAALAVAWAWPIVAAALAAAVAVWRAGGFTGGSERPVSAAEFWSYTRPRAFATGLQIALERVDVILVSALAGEAAAGVYGSISRFITAGNFVVFSIGQATSPGLRRAISGGDRGDAQRLLHQAAGWMVVVAWPYFLLVAVKATTLIELLNPAFADGRVALTVLAMILLTHAATGPIDLTLLMLGHSRASLAIAAAALTIDIVLAVALIPRFGLAGAAIGWSAAVVVQNGAAAVLVHRLGGLRPLGRPAAVAAAGAVVAVVPIGLVTPAGLSGLAIAAVVAVVIHASWSVAFSRHLGLTELLPTGGGLGVRAGRGR